MARTKNLIPQFITFDSHETIMHFMDMTDEKLGAWIRKAFIDLCSGCVDPNTDPFIKDIYNHARERMIKSQNHNHKMYNNRIAKNNEQENQQFDEVDSSRESDSAELTTNAIDVASESIKLNELSKPEKKAYGQNKNVMLTDEEGAHLRELYGEDLKMAIDILDAYIENGGRKAKKYKDHAAVMRRGNWVWNKVKETKLNEKRLENASKPANLKDFKSMREEEQKRRVFTSLYDKEVL